MIIGMTITKDEQVQAVAAAAGLTAKQARDAIDAVVAIVTAGLLANGKITLHGLGMFETRRRSPRRVRNPSTGAMMDIPAKAVVKFKPSVQVRRDVEDRHS
jgi:nucleoid DNA-binding protein